MVYLMAVRKTASLMVIAMVLSLAVVLLMGERSETPAGRVTAGEASGADMWMIFLLGLIVGALLLGAYLYLAHIEAKRKR